MTDGPADVRRVAVIGGGVYGLSVAYFLSRFGDDIEVVLFEQGQLAGETTGRSAGIVRHHYTNPVQIRTAIRGREILERFEAYTGTDGGFRQNGYVVTTDHDESEFRRVVENQRSLGLDVEYVDPHNLASYLPAIKPDGITLAAYEPTAGFADPHLVSMGFADAARRNGVEIHTSEAVHDLKRDRETVTAVETAAGTVPVDCVVNAAGPWGDEIAAMVGVDVPLEWYESKVVVLSAASEYGPNLATLSDHSGQTDMYCKPETGGDFIVGGIDRPRINRHEGLEGVTNRYLRLVGERIARRLPEYADAEVADSWSGVITVTPDSHQIAGSPDGLSNFYQVLGGSGHGFKEAPAFGESLAQTILRLEPTIDLSPYRLERFAGGDPLVGVSTKTYGDQET